MSKDKDIEEKKPRKLGIKNIASKLLGKKKDEPDDSGNGNHGSNGDKPQLTADMIEVIQAAAEKAGMTTSNGPRLPISEETAIKLLDYLCHPEAERAAELTNLTHVQSHAFSLNRIFEEAAKDYGNKIPDPTEVFRKSVYGHRRSVNALFLKELTELAGLQSQDEAIKRQVIGSGLPQG